MNWLKYIYLPYFVLDSLYLSQFAEFVQNQPGMTDSFVSRSQLVQQFSKSWYIFDFLSSY